MHLILFQTLHLLPSLFFKLDHTAPKSLIAFALFQALFFCGKPLQLYLLAFFPILFAPLLVVFGTTGRILPLRIARLGLQGKTNTCKNKRGS
jgi:hypothetical protein